MSDKINFLTHHKCASTWMVQYITELCALNGLEADITHYSNKAPLQTSLISVSTNASYDFIADKVEGGFHVIRNPMSIVLSAYYSHKNTHPLEGWPNLTNQRKILENVGREEGIFLTLAFLERDDFYEGAAGPLHALRHWNFADKRFKTITMEDMVRNPKAVLEPIFRAQSPNMVLPDLSKYTFKAITGREIGAADNTSHYRSGYENQWHEELPRSVVMYLQCHYRPLLELFYPDSLS